MRERFLVIDLGRSLALLAMVIFHFCYDLEMLWWLPQGTVASGFFWYFARLIAGSFILLAGLSLWMAHGEGIRWAAFRRRQLRLGLAALAVSLGTWLALPQAWIFYGVLHSIWVSSWIGLAFLGLPALVTLTVAGLIFALPWAWTSPVFDGALSFTGLGTLRPMTADFEPIFPWAAPFLAGIALGRLLSRFDLWPYLRLQSTPWRERLAWPGRHSLAIYLIHQPVMFGLLFAFTWAWWNLL